MRFTVLRSKAVVNYKPTTRQWEIQNSMFGTPVDGFYRTFKGSKHGSSY